MKEGDTEEMQNLPKPLVSVNGKPMIEAKIKKLIEENVEVCIVVHPDTETLFKEKLNGYNLTFCYQNEPLGTANAVYCARDFIKQDMFLLLMGDDIIKEEDIEKALKLNEPTVFGFEVNDVTGYGAIITDKEKFVTEIKEKELTGKGIVNAGVYIMPKVFFDVYKQIKMNPKAKEYYLFDALPLLSGRGIRFRLGLLSYWFGINTPDELKQAENKIN